MSQEDLVQHIIDLVQENWNERYRALKQSTLGTLLADDDDWQMAKGNVSLKAFIGLNLSSKLQIKTWPAHPTVIGYFPLDIVLDKPLDEYFRDDKPASLVPRYAPPFWAAFSKLIPNERKRYFNVLECNFEDIPKDQEIPQDAGVVEIEPTFIPDLDSDNRVEEILSSIQNWSKKTGINIQPYIYTKDHIAAQPGRRLERKFGPTVLDIFLDTITYKDMARFDIPLEIIDKLRRRKI